ncbi:MAG: hypothetical protein HW386_1732 [Gammaproteobacteria bacterium]|nr:hypothetical protein [Gammaproteobacteria bacterium]
MAGFKVILAATPEELMQFFYKLKNDEIPLDNRLEHAGRILGLRTAQIICAFGFNRYAKEMSELLPYLGFLSNDELANARNDIFSSDIYKHLSLDNILSIYTVTRDDPDSLQLMPYLLKRRLENIEGKIESTVNSLIIDKYKAEMRCIYNDGIANLEFAEERLSKKNSGFRALLNEVVIIIESRLIPAGDIFFRDTILPEEKRKILNKGLIPKELIQSRLTDATVSPEEKNILNDYLRQTRAP